jgi:hypothetical protein
MPGWVVLAYPIIVQHVKSLYTTCWPMAQRGYAAGSSRSIPITVGSTSVLVLGVTAYGGITVARRFSFVWVTVPIATVRKQYSCRIGRV